ncbi:734_t:CDS:1 [Cetraspora pellucida]|uniref:734_t:CDS:1 n=1 Tax=Cetraspora pellucida TaxID=1433469 RepID=A0A9N9N4W5_9GLOM|nr:734_t:CDS:1 [Cetraspora pellucida]
MKVFSKPKTVTPNENAIYKLDTVRDEDWDLLTWISSQMVWEIYVHLFIVIWNTIQFGDDRKRDFNEETTIMISHVRRLNKNLCIDSHKTKKFIKHLENYQNYRANGYLIQKKKLVNLVFGELVARGLKNRSGFCQQLEGLPMKHKGKLRTIVLERMKTLVDISQPNNKSPMLSGTDDSGNLGSKLDVLQNEKDILSEQIMELQKENSKYQAAHGNLTNLGFSDNIVKLDKDIKNLQDLLEEFTFVSGPEYEVDDAKCHELLSYYKCDVEVESQLRKQVLSAALQRLIIETVITEAENYFDTNSTTEASLVTATNKLVNMTNSFTNEYAEKDEIAKVIPTKIRQQVFGMLGCYAFSNNDHPLLMKISEIILEKLNQYRKIIESGDDDNEIIPIIRKVIQLFFYQLKVHPIIPTYKFYDSGEEMNSLFMESAGTKSKDLKKLEVEICYFPVIAILDPVDDKSYNVFSKALIIPRSKSNNNSLE